MRSVCPGCGLVATAVGGPRHPYIGASPECWAGYGELLAGSLGSQLSVDAYAVQHPGVNERRARQSVAVHLVSLCAQLERERPPPYGHTLLRRAVASRPDWPWLDQPLPIGTVTVVDVLDGTTTADAWGHDVWDAWSAHHHTVRRWLDDLSAPHGSPG